MLRFVFAYLLVVLGLAASPASANCYVGDHNCRFHGQGRAVSDVTSQYGQTGVFIVSTANNDVDFDNQILLPDGHGPYIQSDTGTAPIADQPYSTGLEQFRNVGPENYQNNFQNGTVQATHSGDFNGGERPPNPPGCMVSIGNCEEVYIQGNIPDLGNPEGFEIKQTIQLYNYPDVVDPVTTVTSFAAASGKAYIIDTDHMPVVEPDLFAVPQRQELASRISEKHVDKLAGTGDIGIEHTYNIGYNDFDIHAGGLVVFPDQIWKQTTDPYTVQVKHSWTETPYGNFYAQEGLQHTNIYTQYDKVFDFTNKDPVTGMPVLQQSNNVTGQWTTVSGIYGVKDTKEALQYGQLQAQRMQAQYEADEAAGCNFSGCSNDIPKNVWASMQNTQLGVSNNLDTIQPVSEGAIAREAFYYDKLIVDGSATAKLHAGVFTFADQSVQFSGGAVTGIPQAVGGLETLVLKGIVFKDRINPGPSLFSIASDMLGVTDAQVDRLTDLPFIIGQAATNQLQIDLTEASNGVYDPNASVFHGYSNATGEAVSPLPLFGVNKYLFADEIITITKPYVRPSYSTTQAQRLSVQGRPCVDCGVLAPVQFADHKTPLVVEYYTTGKIDLDNMRSPNSVQPHCPGCSYSQGGELSNYSKLMKEIYDID